MTDQTVRDGMMDGGLKLVIAHSIIEALRDQHPDLTVADNGGSDVWLPGGCTPKSAGCVIDVHWIADVVAQEVLALSPRKGGDNG